MISSMAKQDTLDSSLHNHERGLGTQVREIVRTMYSRLQRSLQIHSWRWMLGAVGVVLIISFWLTLTTFRYQLNPDGVSYLSIARAYARFEWKEAVNGYWGPLLSWLITPAFWLGVDPVAWFYVVNVAAAGALACVFFGWVRKRLPELNAGIAFVLAVVLLLTLAAFALSNVTPDMLFCLLLVVLAMSLEHFVAQPSLRNAVTLGLLGAALFYAKAIGLPLFVLAIGAVGAYWLVKWQAAWRLALLAGVVCGIIVLPFCAAISIKYGHLAFSNSGVYNMRLLAPTRQRVHPIDQPGILLPRHADAASPWDDPSDLPMPAWSPFGSRSDLVYYLGQVRDNALTLLADFIGLGVLCIAGVSGLIALVRRFRLFAVMLGLAAVLCGMYVLTQVEARYFWMFIAFGCFGLAGLAYQVQSTPNALLQRAGAVFLMLVLLIAAYNYTVLPSRARNMQYYQLAQDVQPHLTSGARLAYDNIAAFYVCYWDHVQCTGILPPIESDTSVAQLRAEHIDYLLLTQQDTAAYQAALQQYYTPLSAASGLYKLRP